jgi:hypothetical protein
MAIEYRVYAIGRDGHIFDAKALVCRDDAEAIEQARDAFKDQIVEVWSGARFVARLDLRG